MSTTPVPTITDDQVAELEASVSSIWPDHDIAVLTLKSLLAERAELKRDADMYRWLRNKAVDAEGIYPMVSLTDDCGEQVSNWLYGSGLDDAIGKAMQEQPS